MSDFADQFIAQGVEQGIQQGMQQRDASFLLRLLATKFAPATSGTKRRIETADVQTLVEWSEKLFLANSPEDLWH